MNDPNKKSGRNTLKRRIAPGIWEDINGDMHWSIDEMLEECGVPNTPENQAAARALIKELLEAQMPGTKTIDRYSPED